MAAEKEGAWTKPLSMRALHNYHSAGGGQGYALMRLWPENFIVPCQHPQIVYRDHTGVDDIPLREHLSSGVCIKLIDAYLPPQSKMQL